MDIFVIWTEGSDKLKVFVDYLNNLHPTIKFTCSHSLTNIPFLDVMVSLKDGLIETDLYTKPNDKHQYLLISSCHPTHTKRSIPYSLALRLRRICSDNDTYKQHSWLVFETQNCCNLDQNGKKDTIQSLKLENDKLKDKIQEICAELSNLRDEVKAERNGGHAISSEDTVEDNSMATPNSIQEDFKRLSL